MKKNEIKRDPIRDSILSFISRIKESKQGVLFFIIGLLIIIPLVLNLYTKDSKTDYLSCLLSDFSKDILSINEYCNLESVKESISENNSLSSATGIFVFIQDLKKITSEEQQIKKLEGVDFSKINNNLIKAKIHEFFADILSNSDRWSESKNNYLKALKLSNSQFYSAILKFKLSQVAFNEGDFKRASKYIEEALKYDFQNQSIINRIEILKGMIGQAKLRTS